MGTTHFKGRLFVTVPRRRPGIPSTLNYILTKSTRGSSPSFRSFPDFETNELHVNDLSLFVGSCELRCILNPSIQCIFSFFFSQPNLSPDPKRIVSVYRTRVDECNRLWFVDTGLLEYPSKYLHLKLTNSNTLNTLPLVRRITQITQLKYNVHRFGLSIWKRMSWSPVLRFPKAWWNAEMVWPASPSTLMLPAIATMLMVTFQTWPRIACMFTVCVRIESGDFRTITSISIRWRVISMSLDWDINGTMGFSR